MARNRSTYRISPIRLLLLFLATNAPFADALTQSLCSSFNTGADSLVVSDDYQSNGKCFDTCKANYAFAVVQGKNCWCSNYAPADTASVSASCSTPCPGYPFEQCGSAQFFGYIKLNKDPIGTLGASQPQSSSSPPKVSTSISQVSPSTILDTTTETTTTAQPAKASTRYVSVPVVETTSSSSPPPPPPPTTSSIFSTSSTASSASEDGPSSQSTWTPTPVVSVMTVTGQVKTITITPTVPPSGAVVAQSSPNGGFMSHPGKVAGLFVGVALIICLIAAALIWFLVRRKRNTEAETLASTAGGETPQRRQSKMSTMGLLGGTKRSNNRRSVPMIQTSGWGPGNSTDKSPTETPIDYRRTSYPRIVDQRLEPAALWNPLQDNGSHVSIQSFRDDQDYSRRMLRVANPDDRPQTRD
ncbi:MAG: hypothetical protein L6R40_002127 [Gallowayella cf. fulva]|nr:MAG: hypothetical protein L6R40_002127 [Xanthomendoza cf. fulva]